MKILALDSSGLVASVAVVEDEQLIAEFTINYKKTHSQTLVPMLAEVKKMIDLDLTSLNAIAVAAGPGSFTGLRIGSATAKGLGLALDLPIVGVPTIDGLAYNLYGVGNVVCPILDARRNQVYTGIYKFIPTENSEYQLEILEQQCAVSIEEIINKLNQRNEAVIFLGDGVPVFCETLQRLMKVPFSFAPAHMNRQRAAAIATLALTYCKENKVQTAAAIATLALTYCKENKVQTAAEHEPEYLRLSQAERERLEKQHDLC